LRRTCSLRLNVEAIVAINTPTALSAKKTTATVPIVMMRVAGSFRPDNGDAHFSVWTMRGGTTADSRQLLDVVSGRVVAEANRHSLERPICTMLLDRHARCSMA
jgi:hypothetical protein